MKKLNIILSGVAIAAVLSSCSVTTPLAVSAAPIGNKTGVSSTAVLFGGWQVNRNFSLAEAAHNGKITSGIAVADVKTSWMPIIRVLYYKKEIIVKGN